MSDETDIKTSTSNHNALKGLYGVFTTLTGVVLSIISGISIKGLLRGEPLRSRLNALTAILGGIFGTEILGAVALDNLGKSPSEKRKDTSLLQTAYTVVTLATGWVFAVASAGWLFLKGTDNNYPNNREQKKLTAKPVAISAGLLGAELLGGWIAHKIAHKSPDRKTDSFIQQYEQEKLKAPEVSASR